MAKTKKATSTIKKKTKKTVKTKSSIKKVDKPIEKVLTVREMYELQALTKNVEVFKLQMATQDQYCANLILQRQVLENELEKARIKQNVLANEYSNSQKKAGAKIISLSEKYEVKGHLAYDQVSGKISESK